jgi:hypothetical protein
MISAMDGVAEMGGCALNVHGPFTSIEDAQAAAEVALQQAWLRGIRQGLRDGGGAA